MRYSELHLPQQRVDYHRQPAISEARPKDLPILPRQDKRAVKVIAATPTERSSARLS